MPITCIPSAGSPWKGMDVELIIWMTSFCNVSMSASRSPDFTSSFILLHKVYIRNRDSCMRGSLPSSPQPQATIFSTSTSHPASVLLSVAALKRVAVPGSTARTDGEGR